MRRGGTEGRKLRRGRGKERREVGSQSAPRSVFVACLVFV